MKSLLIIDDEANMRHMLAALLKRHGYQVSDAKNGADGVALLKKRPFDYIICDVRMPQMDGLAFLEKLKELNIKTTTIMMSAYGAIDDAVQAMKLGAYDYISKPFKEDEIILVLEKAAERVRLLKENTELKKQIIDTSNPFTFGKMIGKAKSMGSLFEVAQKVAQYNSTVLITGESGTGKELLARGIHDASPRSTGPYIAINCGSIPENLLESELFGYVKGAFTGADTDKQGLFEAAESGSIFLDELGELPLQMQVKLLRVLQEGEIRRVGAAKDVKIDVRVVAATSQNLVEMVKKGDFREDLFYRLNVVHLEIPPLRERRIDINELCSHFLAKISHRLGTEVMSLSSKTMELLLSHHWPGNVRELENVLERAAILADDGIILPENLPEAIGGVSQNRRMVDFIGTYSLKKAKVIVEKKMISRAMEAADGNKSQAARLLEISYPALLDKLKRYN